MSEELTDPNIIFTSTVAPKWDNGDGEGILFLGDAALTFNTLDSDHVAYAVSEYLNKVVALTRADERAKMKLEMGDDGEHYVTFDEKGWFLAHTIDCRIAGMERCPIHSALSDNPPDDEYPRGRYYARLSERGEYLIVEVSS